MPVGPNLILNYDFNTLGVFPNVFADWGQDKAIGDTISPYIVAGDSGNYYARLSNGSGQFYSPSLYQDVVIQSGREYRITYQVYNTNPFATDASLAIMLQNPDDENIVYWRLDTLDAEELIYCPHYFGLTNETGRLFTRLESFVLGRPEEDDIPIRLRITGQSFNGEEVSWPYVTLRTDWAIDLNFSGLLTFFGVEGGPNPADKFLKMSYDYDESYKWFFMQSSKTWATVTPTSGWTEDFYDCPDAPIYTKSDTAKVSVNIAGLKAGKHIATLTFYDVFDVAYPVSVLLVLLPPGGGGDGGGGGGGGGDGGGEIEPNLIPCLLVPIAGTIAASYFVRIINQDGNSVAIFDNWIDLDFEKKINDTGSYSFTISALDDRINLFELDGIIEIWRSIPGLGVGWYREFVGLHRREQYTIDKNGERLYTSSGFGLNHFLARTLIAYQAGTVNADKDDWADVVMKQYVSENCGVSATVAQGRLVNGVLPGFNIDPPLNIGNNWTGSRAYETLLDVLKEIALSRQIDFDVVNTGPAEFTFYTYPGQLGIDRTNETLDSSTGINAYGVVPVVFSAGMGNLQEIEYDKDRTKEGNTILVLGKGDGATRTVIVRENALAKDDSPWNRMEFSRAGSSQDFQYQLEDMGDDELEKSQFTEAFDFEPLQTAQTLYGLHYNFGDRVTVRIDANREASKRIVGVKISVNERGEKLGLKFSERNES